MGSISFTASLPDTTALRISGTGAVVQLLRLIGKAFVVTVEAEASEGRA